MENKKLNVRYLKGYESVENDGGNILIPVYGHIQFSEAGVKRYHATLSQLMGITGAARDLMDWLTAQMDNDNRVYNTLATRSAFRQFYKSHSKENTPTDSTVNNAFAKLKEAHLLLPMGRGCYMVNPEFFINSANEKSRPRLLRIILDFKDGENTQIKVKK